MRRKNKALRAVCCLAAAFSVFAFSGCTDILYFFLPDTATQSYQPNEWNPNEDPNSSDSQGGSQGGWQDSSSNGGDNAGDNSGNSGGSQGGMDIPVVTPTPNEPDPNKQWSYTVTDEMGHKIVYYTDGTNEDLGRVEPLNFTIPEPYTQYGYQYFQAQPKGAELCAFYDDIYNVAWKFHYSGKDLTLTNNHYKIAELDFSHYGLSQDEAAGVWRTVYGEYPEFFWWGNSLLLGGKNITLLADESYAKAATREELQAQIQDKVQDCDRYIDGTTSLVERALTIHDYVATRVTYAYEDDGVTPQDDIWAHNIVGAVQGTGVCEAYAKFYAYLCDFFALDTLFVIGSATQNGSTIGHAWNMLQLGGEWYNIDVTWNDGNGAMLSREWFGMGSEEFSQTHVAITPAYGWGVNYQYELPTPSTAALSPVRILERAENDSSEIPQEEQNKAPMYAFIEEIYDGMVSGNAYVAYLYPHTKVSSEGTTIMPRGARLNSYKTHTEGSLTLVGAFTAYVEGYYTIGTLTAASGLELCSDLTLQDLRLETFSLSLGSYTLTTAGSVVELQSDSTIQGIEGSLFNAQATEWSSLSEVDLYKLTSRSGELRLLGGGCVNGAAIESGTLRLHGTANTVIENLYIASSNERLYIDGASNETQIKIGSLSTSASAFAWRVNITISYENAWEYPVLVVGTLGSKEKLALTLYSEHVSPVNLERPLINLGEEIPYSRLLLFYNAGSGPLNLNSSLFTKTENGDVCLI